jgi:hypothetical protein
MILNYLRESGAHSPIQWSLWQVARIAARSLDWIDKEHDLKSSTFANVSETCPNCGEMNTYSVKNTIWRDE